MFKYFHIVLVYMTLLTACSESSLYHNFQYNQRLQCRSYPEPEKTECLESSSMSFEEYQVEIAKLKERH